MTALYLVDDETARAFAPFALTRPVCELRAGAMVLRHRWERAFGQTAAGILTGEHLADFEEFDAPPASLSIIPAGAVLANSRCVAPLGFTGRDADLWMCEGRVAAVRLGRTLPITAYEREHLTLEQLRVTSARTAEVPGRWLEHVWDLITTLPAQLAEDIPQLVPPGSGARAPDGPVLGKHPVFLERGATVEPYVVFDATQGPILVRQGATIRSFTRLVGPCVVGFGSTVLGDRVAGCSIGESCMVRGEISDSILLGHANKAHDGFVGHSVLGRWVNLGAGTTTSNLKNTYGTVALHTPGGLADTGLLKLGAFLGDHVKTGIGTRLTTGTVIGAGSNVYGSAMPPRYVPPFSWGESGRLAPYRLDTFLRTAERAMGRRSVKLGERGRRQLARAHAMTHGSD